MLISLFIMTSILESFGIALVGPFVTFATNPNLIHQNSWSESLYQQFKFSSELNFVSLFGLSVVIILWVKSIFGFNVQRSIFGFGFGQQAELRTRLMRSYLRAPYTFHLNRNTAAVIQNIINETMIFANGILMPGLFACANLAIVIALLFLLFITNAIATISILTIILVLFVILYRFKNRIAIWGRKASKSNKRIVQIINHGIGSFKETRIIGCENHFESQIKEQAKIYRESVENFKAFSLLSRYILEPVLISFVVGFTVFSLFAGQSIETLAATLGVFGIASVRLLPAASNLLQSAGGMKNSSYVIDLLYNELKEVEQLHAEQKLADKLKIDSSRDIKFKQTLELEQLSYRYPKAKDLALQNINLTIYKGQSIGIIGKSGSGKTTIVDIILGLLQIEQGDIKVDGISVKGNLRSWQNLVGYIPQSIFLIDDTIQRNIAFGVADEDIDQTRLNKAIEAAQLTEVIKGLPQGVDTMVGERGVLLSGGQRQRVGIARALYHEREVLILDEATAALDNETEELITKAIESLSGNKTLIVIAHRLTTLAGCDQIYAMEKGQIIQTGSYQEVVVDGLLTNK